MMSNNKSSNKMKIIAIIIIITIIMIMIIISTKAINLPDCAIAPNHATDSHECVGHSNMFVTAAAAPLQLHPASTPHVRLCPPRPHARRRNARANRRKMRAPSMQIARARNDYFTGDTLPWINNVICNRARGGIRPYANIGC